MKTMHVKPAPGLLVRKEPPKTHETLPADGEVVELTAYWRNRLRDGDVVEVVEVKDHHQKARSAAKKES